MINFKHYKLCGGWVYTKTKTLNLSFFKNNLILVWFERALNKMEVSINSIMNSRIDIQYLIILEMGNYLVKKAITGWFGIWKVSEKYNFFFFFFFFFFLMILTCRKVSTDKIFGILNFNYFCRPRCLKEKLSLRTLICLKTCRQMLLNVQRRLWRSSTLKKTLLHTLRRSLTRNSTQHGIALWDVILAVMSLMRLSISSTSTLDKSPSCFSSLDRTFF